MTSTARLSLAWSSRLRRRWRIRVAASSNWRTRSRSPTTAGKPLATAVGAGIEPAATLPSHAPNDSPSVRPAQAARDRAGQRERRGAPQRNLRRECGRAAEGDRHQRCAERLADEPSGGLKAGSAPASFAWRAADDHSIVGRLEKPKTEAANREPPCE